MCIRDRSTALNKTLSNYFSKNTNLGSKTSSPDMGLNVEEISDDNLSPVSYTHLDVYKRQVYSLPE